MTMRSKMTLATALAAATLLPPALLAQDTTASIQGHATNEIGNAMKGVEVHITPDNTDPTKTKALYTFKADDNGDYKGTGIAPGTYVVSLFAGNVMLDYQLNQSLKAGAPTTDNFDLSRADYIAKLSPERKKEIEEFKAKNAATMNSNKQIANLNSTITSVRADLKSPSPNFDKDVADAKAATDAKPDEGILWVLYGDTLTAKADHAAAADRQNKTNPMSDDAVKGGYTDAITAYKKAGDLLAAGNKPNPGLQATVYNEMGNTLAKEGSIPDAVSAYDKAVSLEPASAGTFYGNEAAVFFNAHQDEPALAAADKAITADPSKPLPYYIKGQELLTKATVDPKTQKIVPPAGCVEAYQKYLELAPDGPQAAGVKDTLAALGEKVATKYSASPKKK